MSRSGTPVRCAQCGSNAEGKFCSNCGASLRGAGAAAGPGVKRLRELPRAMKAMTLTAVVLAAFIVFLIGQRVVAGPSPEPAPGAAAVPDISQMSPDERASRLYDRVMTYSERGQMDSARFFAPMAIQAYSMLGDATPHSRYDIGMIHVTVGDSAAARAEADAILKDRPTHLLGLVLAMRAAQGAAERERFARRLLAANSAEASAQLPEYADHRNDIDGALATAGTMKR